MSSTEFMIFYITFVFGFATGYAVRWELVRGWDEMVDRVVSHLEKDLDNGQSED